MPNITSQPARSKKILDQVSDAIRLKHDSYHTVQELLGHKEVKTTMIYANALQCGGLAAARAPEA